MTLTPRAVLVSRHTELEELLRRHGTRNQAAFFLGTRGRDIAVVERAALVQRDALARVTSAIPLEWRRAAVERADVSRFLFAPGDVVIIVGQDGLVANVAKYLDAQPVIGINPDPSRNPGVLVRHAPNAIDALLAAVGEGTAVQRCSALTMVQADSDDGRSLRALNEIYVGSPSHQTARYSLEVLGATERQASSGLIAATGTGATGWCRSTWLERHSNHSLPQPSAPALAGFVREAWPSPATGTSQTEGLVEGGHALRLTVESDSLVAFGDGIEADRLTLSWGQTVTLRAAQQHLLLVA